MIVSVSGNLLAKFRGNFYVDLFWADIIYYTTGNDIIIYLLISPTCCSADPSVLFSLLMSIALPC